MPSKIVAMTCATAVIGGVAASLIVPGAAAASGTWADTFRDSFSRQSTGSWGNAELGGAYSLTKSSKVTVGTSGTEAWAKIPAADGLGVGLTGATGTDVDISDVTRVAAGAGVSYDAIHTWTGRKQADGSAYTARVRFDSTGKASIGVSRLNGSTSTWLAGGNLPTMGKDGDVLHGELQITGSSPVLVKSRAWLGDGAAPDWQVSYTDSAAAAVTGSGAVTVSDFVNSASVAITINHDDLLIRNFTASNDPAPTPTASPSTTAPSTPAPSSPAPSSAAPSTPAPSSAAPTTPTPDPTTPAPDPTSSAPDTPTPTPDPTISTDGGSSTPPFTSPVDLGNRGAAPIGTASYPVPADAVYVDANSGSDTNTGTVTSPFKTLVQAAAKTKTGKTIVLRGGVYHESVYVLSNKTFTVQNYPGEAVWFDGSVPVTKWSKTGSVWVSSGWTTEFPNMMGGDAAYKARFVNTDSPMAGDPDLMFYDGTQLKQVASAKDVVAGTFAVNDAANTLTIGSNPSGHELRASDLGQAMYLSGPGSVIQGIGFRRYATPYETRGTVRLSGVGGMVRNVVIQDVATIGLCVSDPNKTIDKVTVQRAGLLGIGGNMTDNSVLSNSIVSSNNTENFNIEPVSGGVKFTSARTMTVKNIEANNNIGTGIWMDVSSYNLTLVNNTANGNTKHGIEMEISDTAIIANNEAINGGEDGILVFDSGNVKLYNNQVGGSSLFGIKIAQDNRRQALLGQFPEARDPRYKNIIDPTVPFIVKNISVVNNVFGNGPMFQLYAMDGKTNRAVDTWNMVINGNLFNKRILKTDSRMVAWGTDDNVNLERYETPDALAAAKNPSWTNSQLDSSKDISATAALKSNYSANAVPLPADVAAATGLPQGAKVIGVN